MARMALMALVMSAGVEAFSLTPLHGTGRAYRAAVPRAVLALSARSEARAEAVEALAAAREALSQAERETDASAKRSDKKKAEARARQLQQELDDLESLVKEIDGTVGKLPSADAGGAPPLALGGLAVVLAGGARQVAMASAKEREAKQRAAEAARKKEASGSNVAIRATHTVHSYSSMPLRCVHC